MPLRRQATYRFFAGLLLYPEPERIKNLKSAAQWLAEQPSPHPSPFQGEGGIAIPLAGKRNIPSPLRGEGQGEGDSVKRLLAPLISLNGNLTALQSDYVRLFKSSPREFCYPYEGAYIDPEKKAALTFRLECEYAIAGLKLSVKDFPDHAATELEFMSYLCGHEAAEETNGDNETAAKIRNREMVFLRGHLCRWFPDFARRVADSGNAFYAPVCRGAVDFIAADKSYLEKLITVM